MSDLTPAERFVIAAKMAGVTDSIAEREAAYARVNASLARRGIGLRREPADLNDLKALYREMVLMRDSGALSEEQWEFLAPLAAEAGDRPPEE